MSKQPHYTDHCDHVNKEHGIFVGSTVKNGYPVDVYIWLNCRGERELCIRYGERGEQYLSPFGSPEEWSDAKRMVQDVDGNLVPASCFDGPAMELVRAFLDKEKER